MASARLQPQNRPSLITGARLLQGPGDANSLSGKKASRKLVVQNASLPSSVQDAGLFGRTAAVNYLAYLSAYPKYRIEMCPIPATPGRDIGLETGPETSAGDVLALDIKNNIPTIRYSPTRSLFDPDAKLYPNLFGFVEALMRPFITTSKSEGQTTLSALSLTQDEFVRRFQAEVQVPGGKQKRYVKSTLPLIDKLGKAIFQAFDTNHDGRLSVVEDAARVLFQDDPIGELRAAVMDLRPGQTLAGLPASWVATESGMTWTQGDIDYEKDVLHSLEQHHKTKCDGRLTASGVVASLAYFAKAKNVPPIAEEIQRTHRLEAQYQAYKDSLHG
ncbi:MAG: hypothetical protein K2X01_04500 [Cyanobacteria bacterium]|nr:hypothetical protein [Cyanobacteriota bacterium]